MPSYADDILIILILATIWIAVQTGQPPRKKGRVIGRLDRPRPRRNSRRP